MVKSAKEMNGNGFHAHGNGYTNGHASSDLSLRDLTLVFRLWAGMIGLPWCM